MITAAFWLLTGIATAKQLHFTVLHTSDEHSSLLPVPFINYHMGERDFASGGFAKLAALVKEIRAQQADTQVLLLSSGDFTGGTPFSWLILKNQSSELEIMRRLGYNATTIGNHEFDYGPQILADYLLRSGSTTNSLPVIASNLVAPENHDLNRAGIRKNLLLSLSNGLKVGIFALFGKGVHRVSPDAKPVNFSDQHKTAQEQIIALKTAGAQVIIALTHSGINEDRELAAAVPGIHLILGGHDHLQFEKPEQIENTLIMHSGYYLQTMGQLDLAWDLEEQRLKLCNQLTKAPLLHHIDSSIKEDAEIAGIVNGYLSLLDEFIATFTESEFTDSRQIIARSDFVLARGEAFSESTVGNFITDAMRFETEKVTGEKVDFAIQANGTIRGSLLIGSGKDNAGKICLFDLISISSMGCGPDQNPGYPLVSLYFTGEEIYKLLEISALLPQLWGDIYFLQYSGLRYSYDPRRTFWIKQLPFINKPLPAYRSILSAEKLATSGTLSAENVYTALDSSRDKLYHLVTTRYLAAYLPMIGTRLPRLKLTIKNKQGQPVSLDDTIIRDKGREFKVWEATTRYAASFARGTDGLPIIPERYRKTEGRITVGKGSWLWLWPIVTGITAMLILLLLACHFLRRRRSKKPSSPDTQ
ncbi:MAG: bifunctional metallophosphatase/5'-nucleotidase [Candidatus Riflebacteria bacterium]|nr:bifunctional metallophosphatase/5'-nucleotidase [Candidatus Riflebacteria bacterium]